MAAPRRDRRLAAIMAVDVVGYSRLIGADEAGTLARVKAHRVEFAEPLIAEYRGRVVKLTGDGALVEFASAVDAVECAVAIQNGMAEREADEPEERRIRFRIGINIGDIVLEDGDIFGDGVNVAARLEGLAEPGGICVARNVHNQVKNKLAFAFEPMGAHRVKNIVEPVEVWRVGLGAASMRSRKLIRRIAVGRVLAAGVALLVVGAGTVAWVRPWAPAIEAASIENMAFPLPDKPSIAVLLFDNLSGEPEQEYFVDAITDNIITELSRFSDLFVIARNSVFTYKDKPVKVQEVAEDLGVQYVLEGSVQRSADRMRVTAQLIDALTGKHVWAERYDREVSDVFTVQDEVSQEIVARLGGYEGALAGAATRRAMRKGTTSLSAYETFLIGIEHKHRYTEEDKTIAQDLFNKAIKLDPQFARAYVGLAWTYMHEYWFGWTDEPDQALNRASVAASEAIELDASDAEAHWVLAEYYVNTGKHEQSIAEYQTALALNPNNADVLVNWGWNLSWQGRADEAIEMIEKGVRLNPNHLDWYERALGEAMYMARRYEDAIAEYKKVKKHVRLSRAYLAASYAQLDRLEEARAEVSNTLELDPEATVESMVSFQRYQNPADRDHFGDGLRKAGLPLCATEAQLAQSPDMARLEDCERQRASG
jgi:adenylate cyclase